METAREGLLTPSELALPRTGADVVVVDLRQDRGDGLAKVPGSRHIGLHDGFAMGREDRGLHYDLPTPEELAAALSALGATPASTLVFLDDMGNRWATRAYWVMRYNGHRGGLYVLDGGIAAYLASGLPRAAEFAATVGPISPGAPALPVTPFPGARPDSDAGTPSTASYPPTTSTDEAIRATFADVREAVERGGATLCDVRTPQEHSGEVALAPRAGRVPGSVNRPWDRALAEDGTFLPADRLAEVLRPFTEGGLEPITYCQGGIRASLTWFCLQVLLGRPARLYAGSWEEWARDPELPVVAGAPVAS